MSRKSFKGISKIYKKNKYKQFGSLGYIELGSSFKNISEFIIHKEMRRIFRKSRISPKNNYSGFTSELTNIPLRLIAVWGLIFGNYYNDPDKAIYLRYSNPRPFRDLGIIDKDYHISLYPDTDNTDVDI